MNPQKTPQLIYYLLHVLWIMMLIFGVISYRELIEEHTRNPSRYKAEEMEEANVMMVFCWFFSAVAIFSLMVIIWRPEMGRWLVAISLIGFLAVYGYALAGDLKEIFADLDVKMLATMGKTDLVSLSEMVGIVLGIIGAVFGVPLAMLWLLWHFRKRSLSKSVPVES